MPTTFDLINAEKIASIIFILSGFQSLGSAFKAEEAELNKQQHSTTPSETDNATVESNQLVLQSVSLAIVAYIIFLIVAIFRKEQIEQQNLTGTTNISIVPNIQFIIGFTLATVAALIRIPAIQQRLAESQVPVIQ